MNRLFSNPRNLFFAAVAVLAGATAVVIFVAWIVFRFGLGSVDQAPATSVEPIDFDGDGVPNGPLDPEEYRDGVDLYWIGAMPETKDYDPVYTLCGYGSGGETIGIVGATLYRPDGVIQGYGFMVGELPIDLNIATVIVGSDCP